MPPEIRSTAQGEGFVNAEACEVQSVLDVLSVPMTFDLICDRTNLSNSQLFQILNLLRATGQIDFNGIHYHK